MKYILIAVIFSAIKCLDKKFQKTLTKSRIPRKVSKPLWHNTTPKAETLLDHFGANTQHSQYGPQPRLVKIPISYQEITGEMIHDNLTRVVHYPQGYEEPCDIHVMVDYELCLQIRDCDFCTANPHCGWCESSLTCFPGNKEYAACPVQCANGWIFGERSCTNKISAGRFSNIAPEATGFITPEMAQKKYYVKTEIHHPAVVHTPVLLGVKHETNEIIRKNAFTGEIVSQHSQDKIIPIVGQVHQKMDVSTLHQQFIDANSGLRLDEPEPVTMHGTNHY